VNSQGGGVMDSRNALRSEGVAFSQSRFNSFEISVLGAMTRLMGWMGGGMDSGTGEGVLTGMSFCKTGVTGGGGRRVAHPATTVKREADKIHRINGRADWSGFSCFHSAMD